MQRLIIEIVILCLVVHLNSCQSGKGTKPDVALEVEKRPFHLDLIHNLNNKKDLFLSDFADSIRYIRVETTDQCLIPELSKVIPVKDGFLVINNRHPLIYLDSKGKFIRNIGGIGRGPGEYKYSWMTVYDQCTELVYVCESFKKIIQAYDLNGNYCKSIKITDLASGFHIFSNSRIFLFSPISPSDPTTSVLHFLDSSGSMIASVNKKVDKTPAWAATAMEILFQCDSSAILLPNSTNDTLFQLDADFQVSPFCTYNIGNHAMKPNVLENRELYILTYDQFFMDIHTWCYPSLLLTSFHYLGKSYFGFYLKANREFQLINNPDSILGHIKNDIDGGPSFDTGPFEYYDASNMISYRLLQSVYLLDNKKKGHFTSQNLKRPQDHQRFDELLDTLNENDNPIIMATYMKRSNSLQPIPHIKIP